MKLRSEIKKRLELLSDATEWLRAAVLIAPELEVVEILQDLVAADRIEHQSMLDKLNEGKE